MLLTSWLAFPPATGGKGQECISPSPNSMVWQVRVGWGQISHVHLLSQLTCVTIYTVSSPVLPRQGTGSTSPSSAAGKGEDQLFRLLQASKGKERKASFPGLITTRQMKGVWPAIPLSHPRGQLTHGLPTGSVLLCCPRKVQGMHSRMQLARHGANSSILMTQRPAVPSAAGGKERWTGSDGQEGALSPCPPTEVAAF